MKPLQAADYSILIGQVAAATTVRTANLDTAGADYATIIVSASTEINTNSTNVAVSLLESDDTTASNFATFNSAYNFTLDNTAAAGRALHVNLQGRKRYLRLSVTPDTHTTNGPVIVSAHALLAKEISAASNGIVG
jgi:hypothetical protein